MLLLTNVWLYNISVSEECFKKGGICYIRPNQSRSKFRIKISKNVANVRNKYGADKQKIQPLKLKDSSM